MANSFDRFRGFARGPLIFVRWGSVAPRPAWHLRKKTGMKTHRPKTRLKTAPGKLGWIFLWLIGVPVPILIILYLLRGCT